MKMMVLVMKLKMKLCDVVGVNAVGTSNDSVEYEHMSGDIQLSRTLSIDCATKLWRETVW